MLSACLIQKIQNSPNYEAASRLGMRQRNRLLALISVIVKCDALIVGGGITRRSLILRRRNNHLLSERGQDRPSSRRCRYRISALPLAASR
jgi:hypothetical protein